MRKMLLSAGFMLAITGCGSESASTNAVSAIPLSIKNPATESSINTAASDTTTSNTVGPNKVATLPEGAFESAAVKQLVQKASTAVVSGRNTIAIEALSQAIGIQPEDANLFRMRADVYVLQREMANARADFSTAVRLAPENAELYNFRGYFLMTQGLTQDALADFEKAIALNPNMAAAWNNKGLIGLSKQDYESALLDFTKAVEADRKYVDGWNNRGFARMKLSQNEEAMFNKH